MTRSFDTQRNSVLFLILMGKVILFSWPIGALLLALNPLPLIVENAIASRELLLGAPSATLTAVKLWGFFVLVMMLVSGLAFWRNMKSSRKSKVRSPPASTVQNVRLMAIPKRQPKVVPARGRAGAKPRLPSAKASPCLRQPPDPPGD